MFLKDAHCIRKKAHVGVLCKGCYSNTLTDIKADDNPQYT